MAALWGSTPEIDNESLYKVSFGDMPDETVYENGLEKIETLVDDNGDLIIQDNRLNKALERLDMHLHLRFGMQMWLISRENSHHF